MDLLKWADQSYTLLKQGEGLSGALQAIKQVLDHEQQDTLLSGYSSNIGYTYKGAVFSPDYPSRPELKSVAVLAQPEIQSNAKSIIKKFPEVTGMKVLQYLSRPFKGLLLKRRLRS